jgi:hypothetical protein
MDKKEFRALVKHCVLAKKTTVEAKVWVDKQYSDSVPGNQPLRSSLVNLNVAVTDENIENNSKVQLMVIAETLKISKERVVRAKAVYKMGATSKT